MLASSRRAAFGWLGCVALAASCGARSELPIRSVDLCEPFASEAVPTELDLFLLMDSSGSMTNETAFGGTKWEEITAAVGQFVVDPALEGTGVALAFFPEVRSDLPDFCTAENTCAGEPDACHPIGLCWPSGDALCVDAQDCIDQGLPEGGTCERLGRCQSGGGLCLPDGPDDFCGGSSPCVDVGLCTNRTVCDSAAYELPNPETLPESAEPLLDAMVDRELGGGTPTWPAMAGAIRSAARWGDDHRARRPIVVLATDGLPSSCEEGVDPLFPDEYPIEHTLEVVSAGVGQGIATFVIGVFAPDEGELAQANLDAVAEAGSQSEAFLVTTEEDVAQAFLAALLDVQAQATSCVYTAPWQKPDDDHRFVVRLEAAGQALKVPRLGGANACADSDGFYFEAPPGDAATAVRIVLCPSTCDRFGSQPDSVELQATCPE
ncbi:MAG: VWA domain-containing protein [Myxococcales bacterium]|nr:VWA domain-containing protein [Myxococcales bacterium]